MYIDHHSWLVSWLRCKLGDADQASDLSRDTFVRILAVQESQRELTLQELRAYLTISAHRLLINHVKRVSPEQAYLDVLSRIPEPETMSAETRMLIHETLHMGEC